MAEITATTPWDLGVPLLEISEQSTARATDELVAAVSEERWKELSLSFQKKPGDCEWTVRSADFAGIARLDVAGEPVHLRVTPKIDGLDLFFLADWAYGTQSVGKKLKDARANLAALRSEPAACLLGWYVAEVLAFATRWLRRGYVVREEDVVGRVRGRIDVARYLSRSVAQARPHVIPARFTEPSHDTAANRYVKAGLRKVAVLARAVPLAGARVALDELVRRALSLFNAVGDVPVQPQDALRLNLSGPLRHYIPIVKFTKAMLEGTYVSTEIGGHTQDAIMWSLNGLYEQALRNVLEAWPSASRVRDSYRATVTNIDGDQKVNGSTPVKPDYVMRRSDGALLVLDAKYKSVLPSAQSPTDESIDVVPGGGQRIRVRRADIYQVVAYARHSGLQADKVVLLYPVALGASDDYPAPLRVREFAPTCHLVFFDVGPTANQRRAALYEALDRL
ncbi:5-methylcytosine restriction system specificity protein McrC [Brachybacterium epidermidis]|uniref:5-methylcytosine restriction system specificity protein McrC n=1 Tax=Brachybacterium epidermidis TaxID=2781983 RepID=UPI00398F7FA0